MAKKKSTNAAVAKAAAAAATAAVNASLEERGNVLLFNQDGDDDDDDDEAAELQDAILEAVSKLDPTVAGQILYWELYCDTPLDKAGKIRRLATSELGGVSDECASFGPGEYHVIARDKRGNFVKNTRQPIKISEFARAKSSPASSSGGSDPISIMAMMEERLEKRRIAARAEKWQEIKFWGPILAPVLGELAKGLFGRSNGESLKDLVAAMAGMQGMMGGGGKEVETLLKGIQLAREMEPGDSKGSTWPDVIANGVTNLVKEARPLVESFAARKNATPAPGGTQLQFQPAAAPAPAGTLPASSPAPAAAATPQGESNSMLAMVEPLLRRLAADLEDFASNAADPMLAAEAMLVKIPRTVRAMVQPEQLKEWLNMPDWWEHLLRFHPTLQPYQAFCDDVRLGILELLDPQTAPDNDQAQE